MAEVNARQVLCNLYALMMEISLHRSDEDILSELENKPDQQIERHLIRIKQLNAKLKAQANITRFQKGIEHLKALRERGLEEFRKLIQPHEQVQLMPLFSKFEELSQSDEAAILEDQELLQLMEILKDRLDETSEQ